jgi:hypothetical protein
VAQEVDHQMIDGLDDGEGGSVAVIDPRPGPDQRRDGRRRVEALMELEVDEPPPCQTLDAKSRVRTHASGPPSS